MDCSCLKYRENRRLAKEGSDWDKLNDRVTALEADRLPPPFVAVGQPKWYHYERDKLIQERNEARRQRDDLAHELDEVVAERDKLIRERDVRVKQLKKATDEWCILIKERDELKDRVERRCQNLDILIKERDELKVERDELLRSLNGLKLLPHSYSYWEDQFTVAAKELHDLKEELKDEEGRHQATAAAYSSLMGKLVEVEVVAERDALKVERDELKDKLVEIRLLCAGKWELTKGDWVVGDILKILDGDS